MHAYLASFFLRAVWVRGSLQCWKQPQANSWQRTLGTETTGLGGKHSRCPGSMGPATGSLSSDKADHFLLENSPKNFLPPSMFWSWWRGCNLRSLRSGVHTPRRCRVSHGKPQAALVLIFGRMRNVCVIQTAMAVSLCVRLCPWTDGLCLVWSLKAEPWQDMEAGGTVGSP